MACHPQHRPRDYLPRALHTQVVRIADERHHNLAAYWSGAVSSAAALAELWLRNGRPVPCPLPDPVTWSGITDPVEIRWTQGRAEESEHDALIRAAGSRRTAVLIAAAIRYTVASGHQLTLARAQLELSGLLWGTPRTPAAGPTGCPLTVSDGPSCPVTRLLSPHAVLLRWLPAPGADPP